MFSRERGVKSLYISMERGYLEEPLDKHVYPQRRFKNNYPVEPIVAAGFWVCPGMYRESSQPILMKIF